MGRRTRSQEWAKKKISDKVTELGGTFDENGFANWSFKAGTNPIVVIELIEYTKKIRAISEELDKRAKGKHRKVWQAELDLLLMHEIMGV